MLRGRALFFGDGALCFEVEHYTLEVAHYTLEVEL